jgi:hypothetical protein
LDATGTPGPVGRFEFAFFFLDFFELFVEDWVSDEEVVPGAD